MSARPQQVKTGNSQDDGSYYQQRLLKWVINGQDAGEYFTLRGHCGEVLVLPQDSRAVRLCGLKNTPTQAIDHNRYQRLDNQPGIQVSIDESTQTLNLHASASNFCPTLIDMSAQRPRARLGPEQRAGGFVNYNFTASRTGNSDSAYNGYLGLGVFGDKGVLQSQYSGFVYGNQSTTHRIATFWKFDNPDETTTFRVGDAFAGRTPWRTGTALAGVQITRNYATRPELVTGPVVDFQALADTQAQLLLAQRGLDQPQVIGNAYFGSGYQVPPGPVEVINQPLFSNTVQTLTVREADGKISTLEIPSYFTVGQLRQGYDDFEIAAGLQRQGFSNNYQQLASLFSYRRGMSRWLTLGVGAAAASQEHINGGIFAQSTLPRIGALQTHLATSKRLPGDNQPWAAAATLSNQYKGYSYALSYEQQENGFTPSLNTTPLDSNGFRQWVGSIASQAWRGTSVRLGFQHRNPENAPLRTAITAGVYFHYGPYLRFRLSHTEQIKPNRDGLTLASIEMPLSSRPRSRGSLEASLPRGKDAVVDAKLRVLGKAGYPSIQVRHRLQGGDLTAVSASVERPAYGAFASAVDAAGVRSYRAGVAGGVVMTRGTIKPTRFASGGFALVDLGPQLAGVRINGIPTDSNGRSLLVGLPAFQETELHINQQDLPYNTTLGNQKLIAAPKDLSLVRVTPDFTVYRDALVPVVVAEPQGGTRPLSTAAVVTDLDAPDAEPFPVGFDGLVYVKTARKTVTLVISEDATTLCQLTVTIPPTDERTPQLPPVTCEPTP
ncbi:MAG: fimbria/pilus outer membrane usher protein [Alcanivorax sp.]|nr:fimbria/pilus outer membrane usher protein [Alcanivorax sp.]